MKTKQNGKKRGFLLAVGALLGMTLGGCKDASRPVSGGTTDKTDPKAPKTIRSTEIADFYATFYLEGEWEEGSNGRQYTFTVKKGADGKFTAAEGNGASAPADKAFLQKLQGIIETYKLVSQNGVWRVTAGLPPEFQNMQLTVLYESDEKLTFTKNNDPGEDWIKQVYLAFAELFSEAGDPSFVPPEGPSSVTEIWLYLKDGDQNLDYAPMYVKDEDAIDGENRLLYRWIGSGKDGVREYARFPEDYKERLKALLEAYDLRPFDRYSALYGMGRKSVREAEDEEAVIRMILCHQDGSQTRISTNDVTDLELLKPFTEALKAYYDSLF